jgi:hypothetical protein
MCKSKRSSEKNELLSKIWQQVQKIFELNLVLIEPQCQKVCLVERGIDAWVDSQTVTIDTLLH